jgi:hypothetical protein
VFVSDTLFGSGIDGVELFTYLFFLRISVNHATYLPSNQVVLEASYFNSALNSAKNVKYLENESKGKQYKLGNYMDLGKLI